MKKLNKNVRFMLSLTFVWALFTPTFKSEKENHIAAKAINVTQITSIDDLEIGGKYLIVCKPYNVDKTYCLQPFVGKPNPIAPKLFTSFDELTYEDAWELEIEPSSTSGAVRFVNRNVSNPYKLNFTYFNDSVSTIPINSSSYHIYVDQSTASYATDRFRIRNSHTTPRYLTFCYKNNGDSLFMYSYNTCYNSNATNESNHFIYRIKALESLTYTGTPTKTSYLNGEYFNPQGLTFSANFNDGTSDNVPYHHLTLEPTPLTEGTTSVTATYTYENVTRSVVIEGITVTQDPYKLIGTYDFNETGSLSWNATTSMGAYLTNGYGVATPADGASITSKLPVLEEVPAGSQLKVEIAIITNDVSNTANVTVTGLDRNGSDITGCSGSSVTITNNGATTLEELQHVALYNKRIVMIQESMSKLMSYIKIDIGSSLSTTLLVQIKVFRNYPTTENQALAFANYINGDIGYGAYGSCANRLQMINYEYSLLTEEAKTLFHTSTEQVYVDARARKDYMTNWVALNGGQPIFHHCTRYQNSTIAIVVISIIGLVSFVSFYILSKKRKYIN